jgi:hypothetical protein
MQGFSARAGRLVADAAARATARTDLIFIFKPFLITVWVT